MIDFKQLGLNTLQKQINPRDIFMGLTNKSSKYQYPRDVQGEVWKRWFEQRNNKDTIIKMNTGSGKTIVALMILQSCLNEGFGPALYVVPDNYLVEQVICQAKELGIKVVSTESDLDYQRKRAIMVTNIQKLVNGKSVFGLREDNNYPIGSVIIDDMHACIGSIQEQFSLSIPRNDDMYKQIIAMFSDAMNTQSHGRFVDIVEGKFSLDNMLVPFWSWQDKSENVYQLLTENREKDFVKFKLNLIKDCLKQSHCYISSKEISIMPNCTPIHKISSFDDAKRRIYMSATLPDDSPFVTVMGVDINEMMRVITPEKANDIGERLIIVPKIINKELTEYEVKDALVEKAKEYNVVVLVPSFAVSKYWQSNGGIVLSSTNISEGINTIKESKHGLYVIVNKYDGIDLPDDSCRILVIDGLPNICNMNDKYEQEIVRKSERIQREQIQRIEQGMGRGVRSSNDYCLVYLLGNQLTSILYADDGYKYFSSATKAQFNLSEKLCEQIEGKSLDEIIGIGDYILKRDENWIGLCKNVTADVEYDNAFNVSNMSRLMRNAFDYGLHGEYSNAVESISCLVNSEKNPRMKGYFKQLLAEYVNFTDRSRAQEILKSAKKDNMEVLNPIEGIQFLKGVKNLPEQSRSIIDNINDLQLDENRLVLYADTIMEKLKFEEGTSKQFENAVADIFGLIGYMAKQPERETGKGPDNFVDLGAGNYLVIECKNETTTETISKHDCNQLIGSLVWFENMYHNERVKCVPIMIHHSRVFGSECNPTSSIRIMTPALLKMFKTNVRQFVVAMCQKDNFKNVEKMSRLIRDFKLSREYIVENYTTTFRVKN